jgi:tetratricopeptide (TPR) repeat protein
VGRTAGCGAATAVLTFIATLAAAQEGSEDVREALALCRSAGSLSARDQATQLEHGLALAERAVAINPDDPVAHFAAFCNRGKRVQLEGRSLWRLLGEVRCARRDLERVLTLAPDWPEALAAKGALLLALPRLLGGDRDEGLRLLERAVALDPANSEARLILHQSEPPPVADRVADRRADAGDWP